MLLRTFYFEKFVRAAHLQHFSKAIKVQKPPRESEAVCFMLALPIFPASHPASIVGADELNFCVRDGNRWTLVAIKTNLSSIYLEN